MTVKTAFFAVVAAVTAALMMVPMLAPAIA